MVPAYKILAAPLRRRTGVYLRRISQDSLQQHGVGAKEGGKEGRPILERACLLRGEGKANSRQGRRALHTSRPRTRSRWKFIIAHGGGAGCKFIDKVWKRPPPRCPSPTRHAPPPPPPPPPPQIIAALPHYASASLEGFLAPPRVETTFSENLRVSPNIDLIN